MSKKLYVGNLPYSVSQADLEGLFSEKWKLLRINKGRYFYLTLELIFSIDSPKRIEEIIYNSILLCGNFPISSTIAIRRFSLAVLILLI